MFSHEAEEHANGARLDVGDVVVIDIAYRLSTLGFLALNDTVHNGNYWLSDCIAGLEVSMPHL